MKTQILSIDLIDESIDIMRPEAKDFIGRVRIPMKDLLSNDMADCFPVRDENGGEAGHMEVRITCKDMDLYGGAELKATDTFIMNKFAERDIIQKIALKFADSLLESIEMIFDMLIEPGSYDI